MRALGFFALAAALLSAPMASAQSSTATSRAVAWMSNPANYRVEITGTIDEGPGAVVREDAELQVNVVMRNGVDISIRADRRGVITNSDDPSRLMFHRTVRGEGTYVTSLNEVAAVEVLHLFTGALPSMDVPALQSMHRRPEQWRFDAIRLSGRLYRRNPLTGAEALIDEREIINARPQRTMNYGIWASARLPERFEFPPALSARSGYANVTVLVGDDGMKIHPEVAEVIIERPGGELRISGRSLLLSEHRIWHTTGGNLRWNEMGRVGLRYRYGDHGPFDRDDWHIRAMLVDFCPRLGSERSVCFRRSSHYADVVFGAADAPLVVLNGDGAGTEVWEPFTRHAP